MFGAFGEATQDPSELSDSPRSRYLRALSGAFNFKKDDRWSSAGPIRGMRCVQWLETADPHTWSDNYLCY